MENKNVNEEIMKELGGIKWSTDSSETEKAAEIIPNETEVKEVKAEETVEVTAAETENKEVKAEETEKVENTTETPAETTGKKRDVIKFGNKDWVAQIPENERFTEKTVFCWKPGEDDKIGYFAKYGKKEGMIWINMYKKDSFTLMSREWAARLSDCEVIEQDDKMLSDRYFKDEKGYHVKKADKKDEVAAETATAPEVKVEKVEKAEETVEPKVEEKITETTEMPLAE